MEKQRKDTRGLTVNGKLWEYKIGKSCIAIYNPDGERFFPKIVDIVGESAVKSKSYYLNPAVILDYVKVSILGEVGVHKKCCCCNNVNKTVRLRPNPFNAEIYGDFTLKPFCDKCTTEIAWEI